MVLAIEKPIRSAVNSWMRGREPYAVFRSTLTLAILLRFLQHLRFIMGREGLKEYLLNMLIPRLKRLPMVKKKLDGEMKKTIDDLKSKFGKDVKKPRTTLPTEGIPENEIVRLMEERKEDDTIKWVDGKITGAIYHGQKEHYDFIGQFFAKWAFTNPLHPAIHPALRQMDSEVVQMVINMYGGNEQCCGAFTTGGTESILMAMKAYRDWGKAEKGIVYPNIVVVNTAHAAFDKAGKYFNIFVKHCRTDADMAADLRHMEKLIDGNTVAIVGSACQYAHGTIDPIQDMAKLALRKNIGLHVDCCLGGFLVPFMSKAGFDIPPVDFRVKGVTSISCDPHKYGFAPKGASIVMFSSNELRRHMYCYATEWSGGIYATATMTGSRAGGPVAATWASMCKFGEKGYIETTRQIVGATKQIAAGIEQIPGLKLVGRPDVCVVAFTTTEDAGFSPYCIADCIMQQSHWELATCQNPPCVHLAVTLPSSRNVEQFIANVRDAVESVKADKAKYNSTAGVYGMAGSLPAGFIEDAAGVYLDCQMKAVAPTASAAA